MNNVLILLILCWYIIIYFYCNARKCNVLPIKEYIEIKRGRYISLEMNHIHQCFSTWGSHVGQK